MEWGLDKIFEDWETLSQATQKHQLFSLKYQIEQLRKQEAIIGYVITEFTDLHWECNGVLDFLRNTKVLHQDISLVQAQDMIVPDWKRINYWCEEKVSLDILVSHFSAQDLKNCTLFWKLKGTEIGGNITNINIPVAKVKKIGTIEFIAPSLTEPSPVQLTFSLQDEKGKEIGKNYLHLFLFPSDLSHNKVRDCIGVYNPQDDGLDDKLSRMGYKIIKELEAQVPIAITTRLDDKVKEFILRGGKALVLTQSDQDLSTEVLPSEVLSLTKHSGDWCTNFNWMKNGIIPDLPFTNPLGWEFCQVMPEVMLTGFTPEDINDILSGYFVGWLRTDFALLAQANWGKGKILFTTFRLSEAMGSDPASTYIISGLLNYISSDKFQPQKIIG